MRFVLDNSVAMRWLFADGNEEGMKYAMRVLNGIENAGARAVAPAIWPLEAANVIARAESQKLIPEARSEAFIHLLNDLSVEIDTESSRHALGNTLQISRRFRLSAYDSAYLELALREGLQLATLDRELRRAASRAGVAYRLDW